MNISDLIVVLQKIRALHGDLSVYLLNDVFGEFSLMTEGFISLKSGADPNQEYLLRPSDDNPIWEKRIEIG